MTTNKDQQHPLYRRDRETVNRLLQEEANPYNFAELARLRIRYQGFPGARDIQQDLDKALQRWNLTEETLYEQTRQIHAANQAYKSRGNKRDEEDWR